MSPSPIAARIAGAPVLATRIPFPAALFFAALLTDVAYWRTADAQWTTMSSWLLLGGLVMASIALLAELIRVLGERDARRLRVAWIHLLGDGLAVLLSVVNFVFHVRDGYSAVVPAGPLLSAAVVLILLFTWWIGLALVRRRRAEVGAAARKEA
jgi:uncharacterized membrane protein